MLINDDAGSVTEDTSATETEEVLQDQPEVEEEVSGEAEEADEPSESEAEEAEAEEGEAGEDKAEEQSELATVKVEYDGVEYDVPTELKDALMKTKDYTHKTQELGEARKAFEAEKVDFQRYSEASKAQADKMAQLAAIDQQIAAFEAYDWNAAFDADLTAATKLQHQAQQLGHQRAALVGEIQQAENERQTLYNENLAKTAERTDKQLATEIPNWGDDLKSELGKFAVETMGFPAEAVARAVTPQEIKALYYAQVGFKTLQKVKAEEAKAKFPAKAVKPAKNLKPKRQKAPTDLSKISDPVAYREAYLARKRKAQGL